MTQIGIETLAVGWFLGWALIPLVIWLGRNVGAVDRPGPRKIHALPIPWIGGLGVFVAFLGSLSFAAWATGYVTKFRVGGAYWERLVALMRDRFRAERPREALRRGVRLGTGQCQGEVAGDPVFKRNIGENRIDEFRSIQGIHKVRRIILKPLIILEVLVKN